MDRFRYISEVEINQKGKVVIITLPKYFYIGNIIEVEQSWENILKKEPLSLALIVKNLNLLIPQL
jgi:hypothetical protein